ncbi:MAG: 2-hydroxyacid dehydrogenase [Thermodesulfobacteriota bacterium]
MKVAVFSTKSYDRQFLESANRKFGHELFFFEPKLDIETSVLADGFPGVCVFVNDDLNSEVLNKLVKGGTRLIALRCAGFNNVDLRVAEKLGLTVVRVPAYSPHAVAEHTVALILALNRKIHKAYNRVREGNFSLERMMGFNLSGKTIGIIGTGRIGSIVARIMKGFGCNLLAHDPYPNEECKSIGVKYVLLSDLFMRSDIITLHCPLTPETHHLIDEGSLHKMKNGIMLINTSRGEVIDTHAIIHALKSGKIGYLGLDVYEEEADLFYQDLSDRIIRDDIFARLQTFPNVLITGHQAFFTKEALTNITETTLSNIKEFELGRKVLNQVIRDEVVKFG